MWEKQIGVFPVRWSDQSDEWVFHLARQLCGHDQRIHGLPGQGSPADAEVTLKPPPGSSIRCSLRVRPAPGGIVCVVFDDERPVSEDDAQLWGAAAESAVAQVGKSDQAFAWHAILGPHPSAPEWHRPAPLAEPTAVGPVLLTPGGVRMREMAGYSGGRIDRPWPARYTWPVVASGTEHTYSWELAEHVARKQAHRACALLSVILGTCWIPRSGPDVQIPGGAERGLSAVPQSIGSWEGTPHPDESLSADFNVYDGDHPLMLPAWTQRAWDLMEHDETIRRAVHGCYEALRLEMEHPSAAFVVYVATIEGIGAGLVKERGARRRFKEALKTVVPDTEVEALAHEAYDVRCETGHKGQLFGSEQTFGYTNFSLFQVDDADVFDFALVWPMRKACRELIGNLLRGNPRDKALTTIAAG